MAKTTASVLLDSDVLIDFLRGHPSAVSYLSGLPTKKLLSAMSVAEIYAGAKDHERETIDAFIAVFVVIPVDTQIAREAGLLRRDFAKSHGTGLADAVIAATALATGAELRTLNTKHFPMLGGKVAAPYSK